MNADTGKCDALNIRIKPDDRSLIDRAAEALGRTCADFVLEAARRAAEETLLDRAFITVSPKAHDEFLQRLDAPASPNKRLLRTMRQTPPWEENK